MQSTATCDLLTEEKSDTPLIKKIKELSTFNDPNQIKTQLAPFKGKVKQSVNSTNGMTPLMVAVRSGNHLVVQTLFEFVSWSLDSVEPEAVDKSGNSVANYAVQYEDTSIEQKAVAENKQNQQTELVINRRKIIEILRNNKVFMWNKKSIEEAVKAKNLFFIELYMKNKLEKEYDGSTDWNSRSGLESYFKSLVYSSITNNIPVVLQYFISCRFLFKITMEFNKVFDFFTQGKLQIQDLLVLPIWGKHEDPINILDTIFFDAKLTLIEKDHLIKHYSAKNPVIEFSNWSDQPLEQVMRFMRKLIDEFMSVSDEEINSLIKRILSLMGNSCDYDAREKFVECIHLWVSQAIERGDIQYLRAHAELNQIEAEKHFGIVPDQYAKERDRVCNYMQAYKLFCIITHNDYRRDKTKADFCDLLNKMPDEDRTSLLKICKKWLLNPDEFWQPPKLPSGEPHGTQLKIEPPSAPPAELQINELKIVQPSAPPATASEAKIINNKPIIGAVDDLQPLSDAKSNVAPITDFRKEGETLSERQVSKSECATDDSQPGEAKELKACDRPQQQPAIEQPSSILSSPKCHSIFHSQSYPQQLTDDDSCQMLRMICINNPKFFEDNPSLMVEILKHVQEKQEKAVRAKFACL